MKILRITAQGLPLFKEEFDISFFAQQRVADDDKDLLYPLFSNVYMNCSNALIGINAAGKTSVLKVILLVLNILNNQPINHIETKDILDDTDKAVINMYFHSEAKEVCRLETVITSERSKTDSARYKIVEETLWVKPEESVTARRNLTDFSAYQPAAVRKEEEFLSDDVSIIIAYNKRKKEEMNIVSLLSFTNRNVLPFAEEIPMEVISFLDPTVEQLYFDRTENKKLIHLQFRGKRRSC